VLKLQLKHGQSLVLSEDISNVLILRISSLSIKVISDHTNTVSSLGHHIYKKISTALRAWLSLSFNHAWECSACGYTISSWIQEGSLWRQASHTGTYYNSGSQKELGRPYWMLEDIIRKRKSRSKSVLPAFRYHPSPRPQLQAFCQSMPPAAKTELL